MTLLALTAAFLALPQDQDPPPPAIQLGAGTHRYAWVTGWGRRPDGGDLGNTHGCIVVDRAGRIYCNTDTEDAVLVFDADGALLSRWGKDWKGGLHGMALVREGDDEFLYLAHTARGEVAKTTLSGEVLWTLGAPAEAGIYGEGKPYRPTGVAVADDGTVYVADGYGQSWVHQFTKDREYVRSFGGPGQEPGKLRTPHGIWIDRRVTPHVLLVCDRENHRLQVFSLAGEHLRVIEGDLRRPCNVAVHGTDVAVADLCGRVTVFDRDWNVIAHLGENPDEKQWAKNGVPKDEWRDGVFIAPHGLAFDARGDLYVMDWLAAGRLTKLRRL